MSEWKTPRIRPDPTKIQSDVGHSWISEWMNEWMNDHPNPGRSNQNPTRFWSPYEWKSEWISEWMNEWMNGWVNEIEFCWRIKRMNDQFPLLRSVLVAAGIRQESDQIFATIFWVSGFFIFDALAQFSCHIRHPGSVQKSWKKVTQKGFRKGLRKGHRKLPGKVHGGPLEKSPERFLDRSSETFPDCY